MGWPSHFGPILLVGRGSILDCPTQPLLAAAYIRPVGKVGLTFWPNIERASPGACMVKALSWPDIFPTNRHILQMDHEPDFWLIGGIQV